MVYKCIAEKKEQRDVILFGLVVPVQNKAPKKLDLYCQAEDQHGNQYDIYTEYDPCLAISRTVAVKREA